MFGQKMFFRLLMVFLVLLVTLPATVLASAATADPSQLFSADPGLAWNTFLGGAGSASGGDGVMDAAVDANGNVYVTGFSNSTWGSPVRAYNGTGTDAFVAKLDSSGNLVWNTFLGGGQSDQGVAIALDTSGNVYVTGSSADSSANSWGNPVRDDGSGFSNDAFVSKLDSSGNLVWNTFLGTGVQTLNAANDNGKGIAVDGSSNVFVTGWSNAAWGCSPSCTARAFTAGSTDAFVARVNSSTGALVWNTFLGGSGLDAGWDVAANASVYVTGESGASWGTPVRAGTNLTDSFTDTFVANLNLATGTLLANTFLGDTGKEAGHGIALDTGGNVYVAGDSNSSWTCTPTPCTMRAQDQQDAFAARLDSGLNLVWNTYLGGGTSNGGGLDFGQGLALDALGNVYVSGTSNDTWGSPMRAFTVDAPVKTDVFVARLDTTGALTHNTFLGVSGNDNGYGIAADAAGNAYAVGNSPATWGSPVRAYSSTIASPQNGFVAKVDFIAPTVLSSIRVHASPTNRASVSYTVSFSEAVTGVDATDFSLTTTGVTGASITGVAGSGATRTVTVNTGSGDGTIRLNVLDDNTILDLASTPLNGGFTSGQVYTVSKTLTFNSLALQDGFILESTETSGLGGTLDSTAGTFQLGDDVANKQFRAILHFNTASLPDTAVITKATLKIKKQGLVGTDPFTTHGGLRVDLSKPFFGTASALQLADFQVTPGFTAVATFGTTAVNNVYSAILNTTGKSNINLTGSTQFRLRFATDDNNDLGADFMKFFSGENATVANQPALVIEYFVP